MDVRKMTIIMPCFNCQTTLREAVSSLFRQRLSIPYEIVMVDDGSSDSTWEIMRALQQEHPQIRIYAHEANRGGGAARNTAVSHADGDVIFCLDSDDVLPDDMLQVMLNDLVERGLDGVCIGRSVFFSGDDLAAVHHVVNYENQVIDFPLLCSNKANPVIGNFMYTKASFVASFGYPENQGFDTQGFGFRYVANRNRVSVCNEAYYYQRIHHGKSYYLREYEKGNLSKNWYHILLENLYRFDATTRAGILAFDYRKIYNNLHGSSVMSKVICDKPVFDPAMEAVGYREAYRMLAQSQDAALQLWCAVFCRLDGDMASARKHLDHAAELGMDAWHVLLQRHYIGDAIAESERKAIRHFITEDTPFLHYCRMFYARGRNKILRHVNELIRGK